MNRRVDLKSLMSSTPTYADLIEQARKEPPAAAFTFGSGMGQLAEGCKVLCRVPFLDIPGLCSTSVVGHRGCLTLGDWMGRRVLLLEGRLHCYEGHPWRTVIAGVQAAHFLGARVMILTNAAGGIHDGLVAGSMMLIRDQIEWTDAYPWRQPAWSGDGRAKSSPYSRRLADLLKATASNQHLQLHEGMYAAVTGPCYETPAEIRALRSCGADAVGMSTAREVREACRLGMECAAISCITNRAAGLSHGPINHDEVLDTAAAQCKNLAALLEQTLLGL